MTYAVKKAIQLPIGTGDSGLVRRRGRGKYVIAI
jgi:hypothetical protein